MDIKQFGIDIGLDVLQCNRLSRAIEKLRPQSTISTDSLFKSSPIIHVIVSEEEQKMIHKFNSLFNKVLLMQNNIGASFNILDTNTKKAKEDLQTLILNEMIQSLETKRSELLSNLKQIKNEKQTLFYQQCNEFKILQKSIRDTKMAMHSLISDPSLDLKLRMKKIKKLYASLEEDEAENKFICGTPYHLITEPKVEIQEQDFKNLEEALTKNISVSSCDFPSKPLLTIKSKSSYNDSFTIKWKVHKLSDYEQRPILRFEIQTAVIKVIGNDNDMHINPDKLSWKGTHVLAKKRSHKVCNMEPDHRYFARVRAENVNGYGRFSDNVSVITDGIKLIFDKKQCGNNVKFVKPNRVICGTNNTQNIVVCKNKIERKGGANIFCWEIEVHQYSAYSWIGFIDKKKWAVNYNTFLGQKDGVYSIGMGTNSQSGSSYNRLQNRTVAWPSLPQIGDKYKFKVNWKKNTVDVYQNGKLCQATYSKPVFENLNVDCIVPAVSSNTSPAEYTIRWLKD